VAKTKDGTLYRPGDLLTNPAWPGTRPASVGWSPTHTLARRTCKKSRMVVHL